MVRSCSVTYLSIEFHCKNGVWIAVCTYLRVFLQGKYRKLLVNKSFHCGPSTLKWQTLSFLGLDISTRATKLLEKSLSIMHTSPPSVSIEGKSHNTTNPWKGAACILIQSWLEQTLSVTLPNVHPNPVRKIGTRRSIIANKEPFSKLGSSRSKVVKGKSLYPVFSPTDRDLHLCKVSTR